MFATGSEFDVYIPSAKFCNLGSKFVASKISRSNAIDSINNSEFV
jgi:hypothetical protein